MKQFCDITVLLDRSGSMSVIKDAMEKAFDKFIEEHKVNKTTKISLVQFDGSNPYEVVYQCVPVSSVEKLHLDPRGNTPLVDALCKTIDATGSRLAGMREADRPDQVLFIVITDGQENASRQFKRSDVKDRVTKQANNYNWQFVYLGANQDAIMEAASYGITADTVMNYGYSARGTEQMIGGLIQNTVAHASKLGNERLRSRNMDAFTKEQKDKAEEK